MSHVGGSPVDSVHLLALDRKGHIGEETRVAEAGTAKDDIRGASVVPSSDFGDHTLTFSAINQIRADVKEPLLHGVPGTALERFNSALKLGDSSSNHNDMSALGGELDGESTTHAIRSTSNHDSSTLDGELVLATESEHFGYRIGNGGADQY
jgi:hypothetical protein